MRIKKKLLIIIALLALITCVGGIYAYMIKSTPIINNNFVPAKVDCEVVEVLDGNIKNSIKVQSESNIDTYVRVRFVTYWVDNNGDIMPKASDTLTLSISDGWKAGNNNTYYYTQVLKPDDNNESTVADITSNLLTAPIELKQSSEGYKQVIEVFAEAIQANPENAVTSSWPVTINAGNITPIAD